MAQIYDSSHSGQEIDAAVDAVQTTIPSQLAQIGLKIGDLSELETTDKSDLVSAINEVKQATEGISSSAADTTYVDNQGLGSTNVQGALDAAAIKLQSLGDYYLPPTTEQAQANSPKYMTAGGSISKSGTATMTVAFYEIPTNLTIDKVRVVVPKTGNSSSRVVGSATSLTSTTCTVLGGVGGANRYEGEVDIPLNASYIVVCYNSSSGLPTLEYHVAAAKSVEELGETFSLRYTQDDCYLGAYINKSNGTSVGASSFRRTDYIKLYNPETLTVTCTFDGSSSCLLAYYDENKTYISNISATPMNSVKFVVPTNAKYIRFCCKNGYECELIFSASGLAGYKSHLAYLIGKDDEKIESLKIIHFGNSFTGNTLENIGAIVSAVGGENIHINYCNQGGVALSYWCNLIDTGGSESVSIACGGRIANGGLLTDTLSQNWDIIVFQQVSSGSGDYSTYIPYLAKLIRYARELCPNKKVKIAFNMTWGIGSNTYTYYTNIVNAVKTMRDNFGEQVDIIIPVGTAIENIRGTSLAEGANAFSKDSNPWHLAKGVGEYVAGCAYYCSLIQPFTQKSIYEDTTTIITTSGGTGQVDVTNENRALCQKAAEYANIYKFGVLDVENI